jgi:PleD family two-component response regulator
VLEYLQVNLRTVYRLIKAGKIPGCPRGPAVEIPQSATSTRGWTASAARRRRPIAVLPATGPPAARDAAHRSRILVVDDESSIRDLLAKTLSLAEYDVDTAPDGRSALERLRLYPYDLLIADLKMPGIDGLAVIREAKRSNATFRSSSSPATPPNPPPSRR